MRSDTDFVDQNASSDKAKAWNDSQSSVEMLRLLDGLAVKVAPRKLRLFGIECCHRIRGFANDADCQRAIEYCEAMIEQGVADDELMDFRQQLDECRLHDALRQAGCNDEKTLCRTSANRGLQRADGC